MTDNQHLGRRRLIAVSKHASGRYAVSLGHDRALFLSFDTEEDAQMGAALLERSLGAVIKAVQESIPGAMAAADDPALRPTVTLNTAAAEA